MSYICVKGLTKRYDDVVAVDNISFEAEEGEFVALLGPSGCGKSTTLMMLAGLEDPSEGSIVFNGQDVTKAAPGKRGLSMVFQSYALFPHLSVGENILFGLKARKVSNNERNARLEEVLDLVDLRAHVNKKPGQLSGGQCQRVALARAIVSRAPICLMDEPLSNLDAKLRVQMRIEIKKLHERLSITSVYVTHDQVEAMTLGQRLVVMNAGNVEQIGKPLELYEAPQTKFVAEFIGSPAMNLIDAHLSQYGDRVELPSGDELPVHCPAAWASRAVILGIRPEHFQLAEPGLAAVHFQVDLVEELGADTLVHGHLGSIPTPLTVRLPGINKVRAGEILPLTVTPQHLHLFDPATEQRLD